jgi:hypothetical protein
MARRKDWGKTDELKLIKNYPIKTIQELMLMFPGRSQDSINTKIKRLKAEGKISGGKVEEAIQRSYEQRGTDLIFTIDQLKK